MALLPNHDVRCVAAHICGDCQERDNEEQHKTGALQILAASEQRDNEQANPDAKPDGRDMIQQEMQMRRRHAMNSKM